MDKVRQTIEQAAAAQGVSLAELSRVLGKNVAYLQQFVRRGTPRVLAERDRRLLARFLGVDEVALGAEESGEVAVPYLAVAASAGAGAAVEGEALIRAEPFARAALREAGVAPGDASLIRVTGDSMAPGIVAGDRLLVDRADRRVPRGGSVFVVRRGDELLVKRVRAAGAGLTLTSDNPFYPPIACRPDEAVVIGRAKLLLRVPG